MRSALRMLGSKMPQAEFETLRAEARRIATGFGPAREIDVFLDAAQSGPLASAECPPGGDLLLQVMNKRRHAAYAEARNVINSREASLFVLRIHAFIAKLVAAEPQPSMEQPATLSACKQARKILRRLESRVQKRGSGLQDLNEEARHRLRIALKDLRYGAEFFSSLFKRKKHAARFLQSISELQEVLGSQNDVVATKALITSSSGKLGKSSQALLGFLLGWYAHQARVSEEAVMKTWKNFQKLDGFWH
jgi:CHAD domain-containing protein